MSKKIGRNKPCPCGSGKKHKKCCGLNIRNKKDNIDKLQGLKYSNSISPEVQKQFLKHKLKELKHKTLFGETRPTISMDFHDYKFVAVGNQLYHSKKWKTFHDFLFSYLKTCFGEEWGKNELQKPFKERHIILKWYKHICDYQAKYLKKDGEIVSTPATGPISAYLSISYDLYLLRHHTLLQKRLIERLKNNDQFQGARYELYVTACFIKSGFDIMFEDETDRTTKHCEFVAKHKDSGKSYSVEAKSRHRPGLLGQNGTPQDHDSIRLRVGSLLRNALAKDASFPRIVFIDINMPPQRGVSFEAKWFHGLIKNIERIENESDIPAYLFFTNHPFHYVGNQSPQPKRDFLFTAINMPEFRGTNIEEMQTNTHKSDSTIWILWDSINDHTKIPKDFEE